jgi:raffinose/stachyose/melibiose transport system substrate-binding protein
MPETGQPPHRRGAPVAGGGYFQREFSRRSALRALGLGGVAAAALPALAACSSGGGGRTSLRLLESKAEVLPYFDALAAKFTASQSLYSVRHDSSGGNTITDDFVRGTPPAVDCDNFTPVADKVYVERGMLADLSGLSVTSTINPAMQALANSAGQYQGETNILPFSVAAEGVIYNKDLFEKANVEIPTTWSQLLQVCETLKSKNIQPFYASYAGANIWTYYQGVVDYVVGSTTDVADFFAKMYVQGGDTSADSPVSFQNNWMEPMQKVTQLAAYTNSNAGLLSYSQGGTGFANGAAAMYLQGPWALSQVFAVNPKINIGTFAFPGADDAAALKCCADLDLAIWIPRSISGSIKAGAEALVEYMLSPAVVNDYNSKNLAFSTIKNAQPQTNPIISDLEPYVSSGRFYQMPHYYIPTSIPYGSYFQTFAADHNANTLLSNLDRDWARLYKRLNA